MNKQLRFNVEEAAGYFFTAERTENEEYLLNLILQMGKEYNSLIDRYNQLVYENDEIRRRLTFRK